MINIRAIARRAGLCALLGLTSSAALADVFINELHYDNSGTDVNERVEIMGTAGTNLSGWKIVLYNGGDRRAYSTVNLSGTLASQCGGHGTAFFAVTGIQNGNPDGVALINASNAVVEFITYGGTFVALDGLAAGRSGVNMGVSETASTLSTQSLQRKGTGSTAAQFTWSAASTSSWGACNSGQTLTGGVTDAAPMVSSTSPAANATGVAASSNVTINFSEAVTLATGWSTISCTSGARPSVQTGSGSSYTLNPATDFAAGDVCSVSVLASSVTDTDGTPTLMAANYNFSFTVAGSVPPPSTVLQNGVAVTGIGGAANVEQRYTMVVPSGATNLNFAMSGGSGDADLYVKFGSAPSTTVYDCRPYATGNTESCPFATPSAGTWHVMVRMYNSVAGVSLTGSYSTGTPTDAAPTVSSTSPASGASSHPVNGNVGVTFSESVTLAAGWNTLVCTVSGSKVTVISGSGASYTLNPNVDFTGNESCTLTVIASKVTDIDGTPTLMVSNYVMSFGVAGTGTGYYASVNATSSANLRATLHPVIDDHTKIPYTASTTDVWDVLNAADQDPLNSSRVLDVYKNASYAKQAGGNTFYNREHTWPKSLGFPDDGASNYPYSDTHMLMVSDIAHNSARGNLPFNNCPAGSEVFATLAYYGQGGSGQNNLRCGNYWQVWDKLKGNVARAMFYFDIRYEGGTHGVTGVAEPNLILTDNASLITASNGNASVAYMGLLSVLLQWHAADPVDDRERLRNETVFNFQGNRNPFVDRPEWVACLFQNVCP